MSLFVNGLLGDASLEDEIKNLSSEDLEMLKNALQGELISNPDIKEALLQRAREVIARLEQDSGSSSRKKSKKK